MPSLPISRRSAIQVLSASLAAAATLGRESTGCAAPPRALPKGKLPDDVRLGDLKDLNGYFPWTPSATKAEWDQRAEYVRRQLLVACGLWPMPARHAIHATVHGKIERDNYTVEKVSFQSHPGLYVTGSLYRPLQGSGKRPGVLCPHGHWANGRFHDHGEAKVKQELELQAEQFAVGGRHPLQARAVHLARMGCVVFLYDMLGYADNTMLSFDLIHRFGKQRPEMSTPERWGLFSAQSELRLLNALGLQTWNSIRALDWLETLDDVDPQRIAVTGASGGGTQTFMLGAVDPRPVAFFPAVMVSTSMQGGCTCENATYLRVGTGNIEFAAMLAPRTVGLSGANDWTREIETKGLPQLQQHFAMLGVPDKLSCKYFAFEHNYNQTSRAMMYGVFQKALGLDGAAPAERDFVPLTQSEASVWTADHPQPPTGDVAELLALRAFADEFDQQLAALTPKDSASLAEYRTVIGGGWDILIGRDVAATGVVESETLTETQKTGHREYTGLARNKTHHEELPFLSLVPDAWNRKVVLWVTDSGKQGLLDAAGNPIRAVQQHLNAGLSVVGLDLLYQGEFLPPDQVLTESRRVNNPREFLGFTAGYNHPLFSQRVHDVLTAIVGTKTHPAAPEAIFLVGAGGAALYAAAAAAQAGQLVSKLAISTNGYRFGTITDIRDPMLLPGAVRYGDVPGLLALRAPLPLMVTGETAPKLATTAAAYAAAGASGQLKVADAGTDLAAWLIA